MQWFICVVVKFLFIFKHDQSHVMINGDAHKFKGDNSSFYSPLQFEYYRQGGGAQAGRLGRGRPRRRRSGRGRLGRRSGRAAVEQGGGRAGMRTEKK
jgi:hypothetical protein